MLNSIFLGIFWYLVLSILGLVTLPCAMKIFRRMPDHGILVARPLGWLLVGTIGWWLAYIGLLPFSAWGMVIVAALIFAASAHVIYHETDWVKTRFKKHWRTALNGEIITLLVFILVLFVRMFDPSIDSTEKPMDAMLLSALTAASWMPPEDAWFAGYSINYHYGGYLLHSVLIKLTGVNVEYGYNLAIATVASMAASVAFVLGRALFGRCRYGVVTVVCTLFVGNMAAVVNMLTLGKLMPSMYEWRFSYLWNTSRVITDAGGDTINEYPFFSIVWGDVHPHFSNMVFFLLFMLICYAIGRGLWRLDPRQLMRYEWPLLVTGIISCGFLLPTNIFDFPILSIFYGLLIAAMLIRYFIHKGFGILPLTCFVLMGILPVMGFVFALPFFLNFTSPLSGPKLAWAVDKTDFIEFLLVFGAHFVVSVLVMAIYGQYLLKNRSVEEKGFIAAALGILTVLVWAFSGSLVIGLSLVIALAFWATVLGIVIKKSEAWHEEGFRILFAAIACALAWSIIVGCELVYIPDSYGIARMNTLFKFHFAAWLLFGVGLPYLVYRVIKNWKHETLKPGAVAVAGLALLLSVTGPAYTLTSLFLSQQTGRQLTLNGLRHIETGRPTLYELIRWIRENTEQSARIAEIPGGAYKQESLVSAFTGRASVIGWVGHERLWRANDAMVGQRETDAYNFFTTQNQTDVENYVKSYQIDYAVFVQPDAGNNNNASRVAQMKMGVWREALQPVFEKTGHGGAPFFVYKVPDSMKEQSNP